MSALDGLFTRFAERAGDPALARLQLTPEDEPAEPEVTSGLDALFTRFADSSKETTRVEDADTVALPGETKGSRLTGFDARETAKFGKPGQPGAGLAADVTREAVEAGMTFEDTGSTDHYGRPLRDATRADGEDHAAFMIRQGLGAPTQWSTQEQANQEMTGVLARSGITPELRTPEERGIQTRRKEAIGPDAWEAAPAATGRSGGVRLGTTGAALSRGIDNTQSMFNAFGHAVATQFGADETAEGFKDDMERNQRQAAATPPRVASWDDVTLKNFPTYALEAVVENIPNMGVTLAGGLAAAASGGTLPALLAGGGGFAARQALWSAGKRFAMGSMAASYGLSAGEVQQELLDAGIDASGTALVAGIPMSALDAIGMTTVVGSVFKGMAKKQALKIIEASGAKLYKEALAGAGRGLAVGAASEAATEALQEAIVLSARAYEDPTFEVFSEENIKRIREAAIKGGIAGGVMSGTGSAVADTMSASRARDEAKELGITPESTEADVEAAMQARAEARPAPPPAPEVPAEAASAPPIVQDPGAWIDGQFDNGRTNAEVLKTMPAEVKSAFPNVGDVLARRKAYDDAKKQQQRAANAWVPDQGDWDAYTAGIKSVKHLMGEHKRKSGVQARTPAAQAKITEEVRGIENQLMGLVPQLEALGAKWPKIGEQMANAFATPHDGVGSIDAFLSQHIRPMMEATRSATPEAPRAQGPAPGTPDGVPRTEVVAPQAQGTNAVAQPAAPPRTVDQVLSSVIGEVAPSTQRKPEDLQPNAATPPVTVTAVPAATGEMDPAYRASDPPIASVPAGTTTGQPAQATDGVGAERVAPSARSLTHDDYAKAEAVAPRETLRAVADRAAKRLRLPAIEVMDTRTAFDSMDKGFQKRMRAGTLRGAAISMPDGRRAIWVDPRLAEAEQVGILAHELGHHVRAVHWRDAPRATRQAVIAEYEAWRKSDGAKTPDNSQRKLFASRVSFLLQNHAEGLDATPFAKLSLDAKLEEWASFDEWFADQTSRALLELDVEATNPVQAFFQEVADLIRTLYNQIIDKTGVAPAPSVQQFVKDIMAQRLEEAPAVPRETLAVEQELSPLESYEDAGYGDEVDALDLPLTDEPPAAKDDLLQIFLTENVLGANRDELAFKRDGHTLQLPLTITNTKALLDGEPIPAGLLWKAILANPHGVTKGELMALALESRTHATHERKAIRYAFNGKISGEGDTKPVRAHPLLDAYKSVEVVDVVISREVAYREEDSIDLETQYKQALGHLFRDLAGKNRGRPPEDQQVMVARKKGQVLVMTRKERDALYASLGLKLDDIVSDTNKLGRIAATVFRVGGHQVPVDAAGLGKRFDNDDNDGTLFISDQVDGIVQGTLILDYADGTKGVGKGTGRGRLTFALADGKIVTEEAGVARDLLFGRSVEDKGIQPEATLHVTQLDSPSGSAFPYQSVLADLQDPAGYIEIQNRMIENKGIEGIASRVEQAFIRAGWPAALTINKDKFSKLLKQMKVPAVRDYAIGSDKVPRDGVVFLEDTLADYLKAAGVEKLEIGDLVYLHREPSLPTGTGTIEARFAGTASFGPSSRQRRGIVVNPKNPKIKGLALDFDGDRLVAIAPHEGFVPRTAGNEGDPRPVDVGDLTALVRPDPRPLVDADRAAVIPDQMEGESAEAYAERVAAVDPINAAIIRDADALEDRVGEAINLANKLIESGYDKPDASQLRIYTGQIANAMISSVKKAVARDQTAQLFEEVLVSTRRHAEDRGRGRALPYITSAMSRVERTPARPRKRGGKTRLDAFRGFTSALRKRADSNAPLTGIERAMLRRAEVLLDQHRRTGLLDGENGRTPANILRVAEAKVVALDESGAGSGKKIAAEVADRIGKLNEAIRKEEARMLREFDDSGEIIETPRLKELRRERSDYQLALAVQVRLDRVHPAAILAQPGLAPSVTRILRPQDLREVYDLGATTIEVHVNLPNAASGETLAPGEYDVVPETDDAGNPIYTLVDTIGLFGPVQVVGTGVDAPRLNAFLENASKVVVAYEMEGMGGDVSGIKRDNGSFRVHMQRTQDVEVEVEAEAEAVANDDMSWLVPGDTADLTMRAFDDAPAPLTFMHSRRLGKAMNGIRTAWDQRDNNDTYLSFVANASWAARNTVQTVGSWMRTRGPTMAKLGGMFLRTTDARADYTGHVGPWETAHRMHFARLWNLGFDKALTPLRKKERLIDKALQQSPGLKTGDAQYERVVDLLTAETPLAEIQNAEDAAIVAGIRAALEASREYSNRVFSMGIEKRANYWPVVVDMVKFEAEREKILLKLTNEVGLPRAKAEAIWEDVVRGEGTIMELIEEQAVSRDTRAVAPGFEWANKRKWSPAVHAALREYQIRDIGGTLTRYLGGMAKRGTTQKMFGRRRRQPNGKTIMEPMGKIDQMLKEALEANELSAPEYRFATDVAIPALFGQLGVDGSPQWRALSAWGVTYQNLRLLGMVVFSSFVDPALILSRSGVRATFGAVKDMIGKGSRAQAMDQLRDLGAMRTDLTEAIANDALMANAYYGAWPTKINETFFRAVQMHRWTNFTRRWALGAAKRHLTDHAARAERSPLSVSAQRLKAVGVTVEQVRAWQADGAPVGREEHEAVNFALNQLIDDAVLRPTAAIRPGWTSDARLALVAHLKAFFFAFYERALRHVWTESARIWGAEKGAMKAMAIMPAVMLAVPALLLSAVGYELRRKVGWWGDVPEYMEKDGLEYIFELSQRAGIYGPLQFVLDAESTEERGRSALLAILGPQAEQFQDLYKGMDYALWRAIPGLQQFPAARQWLDQEVL